jgi:hypothetical protein
MSDITPKFNIGDFVLTKFGYLAVIVGSVSISRDVTKYLVAYEYPSNTDLSYDSLSENAKSAFTGSKLCSTKDSFSFQWENDLSKIDVGNYHYPKTFNTSIGNIIPLLPKIQSQVSIREVDVYGNVYYKVNGKLHREDGPAVEWCNGSHEWFQNHELHREGGPAIEYANGEKSWYQHGKHHRLDGPAVEMPDGRKEWWQDDKLHRLNGPAIVHSDGTKEWYQNGQRHRVDGPATVFSNGDERWYISGVLFTKEAFDKQDVVMEFKKKMSQENKNPFVQMIKGDMHKAAVRVGAEQITNIFKEAMIAALRTNGGDNAHIEGLAAFLDTKMGEAMISVGAGLTLTYAPMLNTIPKSQVLAEEFRVKGMATAGNFLIETVGKNALPLIKSAIDQMPEEQIRVAAHKTEELPQEEIDVDVSFDKEMQVA